MVTKITATKANYAPFWDNYVNKRPESNLYHLFAWRNVIEKTYGHKTYYLMATNDIQPSTGSERSSLSTLQRKMNFDLVVGILPLVLLRHVFFGNSLVSLPFFDMGGIIANDIKTEELLLREAIGLCHKLKAAQIELRHVKPLSLLANSPQSTIHSPDDARISYQASDTNSVFLAPSHKVRLLLSLPASSDVLMKSFKSKLRSQIRKPLKNGLIPKIGGLELLNDFYRVFSINMRDLGSPVHSKNLMKNVLEEFADKARIIVVYKDNHPLAASMIVGFKDTLQNPWASALRQYSHLSPNMLLYWTMLEYACDNGYSCFDFGRSSPDGGTYRFKKQWGAKPSKLYWHYISVDGKPINPVESGENAKFQKAITCWQKLPVSLTRILGPLIRKRISL